jgi:hypothetical protein
MRYSTLLVAKNSYLKAFRNFELMLKTYSKEEQQARILMEYGEFYTVIDESVAKERLKKSLELYIRLTKINNKRYEEIDSLRAILKKQKKNKP